MVTLEEVKKVIDLDSLSRDKEQSLFGNILDWCRDYFNQPKVTFWHIAEQLVEEYKQK